MKTYPEDIVVIKNRVKYTQDYSGQWYEGDRPNLNWCAFLMHLQDQKILENKLVYEKRSWKDSTSI